MANVIVFIATATQPATGITLFTSPPVSSSPVKRTRHDHPLLPRGIMILIDLTGWRFGRLTVVSLAEKDHRWRRYWNCRCDCGSSVKVSGDHLKSGHSQSCGCFHREDFARRQTKHGRTLGG